MPPKVPKAGKELSSVSKKRKEVPHSSNGRERTENPRAQKRVKTQNARTILTQTSDAALSNGELDLQAFLKAREFEIKALEDGMRRSKNALTARAFQQVPREMRRRTASHNVKRVPKRLQKRATREMKEDNTPTVTPSKRKPRSSRGRLRAETAKKLGLFAKKKKNAKVQRSDGSILNEKDGEAVVGRLPIPKARKNALNVPPRPKSKFRKRQIHKTWLPTHIYHAKRARMTEPKNPLWRMAIPLTPTEKSYRPSHRAGSSRGALCWDMSYMSTIGLEGVNASLEKVLRAVGVTQDTLWGNVGEKWRKGKRTWSGWLSRNQNGCFRQIGPATVIWCCTVPDQTSEMNDSEKTKKIKKSPLLRLFIRIHPSAFLELWNELLRVSKMQRPAVVVEDLRFEIGSIEVTGPASTEVLLGVLHPFDESIDTEEDGHMKTFKLLRGVTNSASLPPSALLAFQIMDPRLRYPPRKAKLLKAFDEETTFAMLETLTSWPADGFSPSPRLFDREFRLKATRLPSQKAINRRKGAAPPGEYPSRLPVDQPIPILLYTSRATTSSSAQGTWTLLAPWKCILPIWYCLTHCPLSSGNNPRFGGLQELQQMHFEHGKPWFPADYPGTDAGWAWEVEQREMRKREWDRRPRGKKVQFESLDLGGGRKGEIGLSWACDFEKLKALIMSPSNTQAQGGNESSAEMSVTLPPFSHLAGLSFSSLLSNAKLDIPPASLVTVRLSLFSRGVPLPCARIYRLPCAHPSQPLQPTASTSTQAALTPTAPSSSSLRSQWLALAPTHTISATKNRSHGTSKLQKPQPPSQSRTPHSASIPAHLLHRRALAQELLQSPPLQYPAAASPTGTPAYPLVPDEDDLIGFVTTGSFNLAEGKGSAIGSLAVERVLEGLRVQSGSGSGRVTNDGTTTGNEQRTTRRALRREDRICIIRNAGESVGRLAIWDALA